MSIDEEEAVGAPDAARVAEVEALLAQVLGHRGETSRHRRRSDAQRAARPTPGEVDPQLAYGELDVVTVAKVLAAAGVRRGDRFVDIGSGDGVPTLAAAMLYPDAFAICRGIEIVAALVARSRRHEQRLRARLASGRDVLLASPVELIEGDVYHTAAMPSVRVLRDSTLALCFATTWSHGAARRELPRLSAALASMPPDARVIVVDGRLLEADGWRWEGDLRIVTPDTAPYSTARLYSRLR